MCQEMGHVIDLLDERGPSDLCPSPSDLLVGLTADVGRFYRFNVSSFAPSWKNAVSVEI